MESNLPKTLKISSVIWIAYGLSLLISSALILVSLASYDKLINGIVIFSFATVFSLIIIYSGINTLNGKFKDTIGNGIGSIFISFWGIPGIQEQTLIYHETGSLISFVALMLAGVLALIGRSSYKNYVSTINNT